MTDFELSCPKCGHLFDASSTAQSGNCGSCGAAYTCSNGIVDFIPNEHFYWGEISQDLMTQINDHAEKTIWFEALKTHLTGKHEHLLGYILDPVRYASIYHFYDEANHDACLDLGSGWGPITFGLRRFYKKVYSVDGVYERLRFQAIRAAQTNIQNIKFLRSTMLHLPIPDNSVDIAIANGLFEWIGLSETDAPPSEVQERFLKEVLRVLKPGGRMMIGIENRFGLQYFLGGKDHSGLRFTSIMPRKLADAAVRQSARGSDALVFSGAEQSYRTLTYSYWGYKRFLEHAGYCEPEIYWTWPGYNYPRVSGTTEGDSIRYYLGMLANMSDNTLLRSALRFLRITPKFVRGTLLKTFSPHFLIVADKAETNQCVQDTLIKGNGRSANFLRTTLGTRVDLKTTYLCTQRGNVERVLHLQEVKSTRGSSFQTTESSSIPGRNLRPYLLKDVTRAADWLAGFQNDHRQGVWEPEKLMREIQVISAHLRSVFPANTSLHAALNQYILAYSNEIRKISCPIVQEHGDYTPPNILVDAQQNIAVVDWEHTITVGNPLMDVGAFYLSLLRRNGKTRSKAMPVFKSNAATTQFTQTYQARTNVSLPLQFAPAYYLLRIIDRHLGRGSITPYNYTYIHGWARFVEPCLLYATQL